MPTALMTVTDLCDRIRTSGRDPEAVMHGCPDHALRTLCQGHPVRTGLSRTVPEQVRMADAAAGDGLDIEGHWTVFNSLTEIKSWEGAFTEQVLPGATKKTLREGIPKMQFDHGHHPLLGSLPLGTWNEAKEDDHGSWSRGRMADNWLVAPFADAIRGGRVTGMSFRFSVVREKWFDATGAEIKDDRELMDLLFWEEGREEQFPLRRDLLEVSVTEAGPVVWPAYKDTDVGARSADGARVVIDLAALSATDRSAAGHVVALLDAELARAEGVGTPRDGDPADRFAPLGRAELARLAGEIAAERHNAAVDTATVVHTLDEPQTTVVTAAGHPGAIPPRGAEPDRTVDRPGRTRDQARGTDERRPANPTERREYLRDRYRVVLDRTLALPTAWRAEPGWGDPPSTRERRR